MANSTAERQIVSLKIVHTSDVHGSFFMRGSLFSSSDSAIPVPQNFAQNHRTVFLYFLQSKFAKSFALRV